MSHNRHESFRVDKTCETPTELLKSEPVARLLRIYNHSMRAQCSGAASVPLEQAVDRRDVIEWAYAVWKGRTGMRVRGKSPDVRKADELADQTYKLLLERLAHRDQRDIATGSLKSVSQQLGLPE